MSRRGNRHDNAFAESFFQLLKRGRIKHKTCATRAVPGRTSSTTSRCSRIRSVVTVSMTGFHQLKLNEGILNRWRGLTDSWRFSLASAFEPCGRGFLFFRYRYFFRALERCQIDLKQAHCGLIVSMNVSNESVMMFLKRSLSR